MIAYETQSFFKALVLGTLLAVLYDFFRVLRLTFPHGKILVFFEDILYFIFLSLSSILFIIIEHEGYLRGFLVLGELLGMILYFFTISIPMMKLYKWIISKIKYIIKLISSKIIRKVAKKITFKPLKFKIHLKK